MEINLDPQELRAEIVEQAAQKIVESFECEHMPDLNDRVETLLDTALRQKCDDVVGPIIEQGIEAHVIQITNNYGEAKGEPKTFTEYLVGVAEGYLNQHVDYHGKEIASGSYGYKDGRPRVIYMIDQYLHMRVQDAVKEALAAINKSIAPALAEVVKNESAKVVAQMTKSR